MISKQEEAKTDVTYRIRKKEGNELTLTIFFENNIGLRKIIKPDEKEINIAVEGKKKIAVDYIVEAEKEYKFKIFGEDSQEEEYILKVGIKGMENVNGMAISTVEDLINIKNNMSGKYFLVNDIDLAGINWRSIGENATFYGTLDGNGYVIRNLTSRKTANYGGLFYKIKNATIKNLGMENVTMLDCQTSSPIASYVYENSKISCCYTTGHIESYDTAGLVTGLESLNGPISIENCYSTISMPDTSIGGDKNYGICVEDIYKKGNVKNCYFSGSIAYNWIYKNGGIVSVDFFGGTVTNSYYNKELTPQSYNKAGVTPYTTAQMTDEQNYRTNYKDWDFDTIWYRDETTGYPKLRVFLH